jgi:hypothetical protein
MMMMMFLLLMIFGLAHFSMLAATKQMLDYAAFAAARTALVGRNFTDPTPQDAASQVMDAALRWSNQQPSVSGDNCNSTPPGLNRRGLRVQVRVPFGLPIFNNIPAGGLLITALAPCIVQPTINESGDNASGAFGF